MNPNFRAADKKPQKGKLPQNQSISLSVHPSRRAENPYTQPNDATGHPITPGDEVIRLKDVKHSKFKIQNSEFTGTVTSVHNGRCHVTWSNDPVGTFPHCCRLFITKCATTPTKANP